MKAWVLNNIGEIEYKDTENPVADKDRVIVKVKAAGICGSDIPRIYTNGAHKMPLIPGHEFSGEVVETTAENERYLNKRVGIFPLIPCKKCGPCLKRQYEMCRNYDYLGSRSNGGFAEYVAVPVWNLIELPDTVTYEAAAMLEPMAVSVHAFRKLNIGDEGYILVYGAGTIGILLSLILFKKYGKRLLVVGNKNQIGNVLCQNGFDSDNYMNSQTGNVSEWIKNKTNNEGVLYAFECVGKNETLSDVVGLMGPAGEICIVGNPYSDMTLERDIYWKILRNQLKISGTWNSSFLNDENIQDDWKYAVWMMGEKIISPEKLITHKYSPVNLRNGFEIMRDKKEYYIKIMMSE